MGKILKRFTSYFLSHARTVLIVILMFEAFSVISAQNTWISIFSEPTDKCFRCVYSIPGAACYVGGDSGTILLSSYYYKWVKQQSGTTNDVWGLGGGTQSNAVAIGKTGTIISTAFGGSWHSQVSNTKKNLRALAFGRGNYVAVGDSGLIITSPDDSIWTTRISGTTRCLRSVTYPVGYMTGFFTAVGDSGTILTSPDGIIWTNQTSGTIKNLNAVASGNLFGGGSIHGVKTVVVGDSGIVLTSSDSCKTWNSQTSGTTNALWGIFCLSDDLNGRWLFYATVGEKGTILTSYTNTTYPTYSLPGVVWTPQTSGTTRNLYGVSWGYLDSIVAVGDSGTVLTSYYRPVYTGIKQGRITVKPQLVSISNNHVSFTLTVSSRISIALYDTKGRFLKTLINRMQQPGSYSLAMPHELPPGVYTVVFKAGNQKIDKTIVVSR